MRAQVTERVLGLDEPLAVDAVRSRRGGPVASVARHHKDLAHERLVPRRGRHTARVPAQARVAVEVAHAVDERVACLGALREAVGIVAVREVAELLVAQGEDGGVRARVADDVDAPSSNRGPRGEGVPVLVHARSGRCVANIGERIAVEGDGGRRRVVDLEEPVVSRALSVLRKEEGGHLACRCAEHQHQGHHRYFHRTSEELSEGNLCGVLRFVCPRCSRDADLYLGCGFITEFKFEVFSASAPGSPRSTMHDTV